SPKVQLVDLSTLENGSGKAIMTQKKPDGDHELISTSAILVTPFMAVGVMAYNTVRTVVIPFYILGRMAQGAYSKEPACKNSRKFEFKDISKQMATSLLQVVRTPFYATAYLFSAFYSFIDPEGGRKLGCLVSHEWMGGVERSKSFWTIVPASEHFQFEGGGTPEGLGQHAYYWTGCWMPWGEVEYRDHEITRAYYPGKIYDYNLYNHNPNGFVIPEVIAPVNGSSTQIARGLNLGESQIVTEDGTSYLVAYITLKNGQPMRLRRADCNEATAENIQAAIDEENFLDEQA
ncbi:MAG: hypothetical protein K0U13_00525, partial [Chlamydiae bacterium]|nr:hypothetical protein [Chlamydiota bacterium]